MNPKKEPSHPTQQWSRPLAPRPSLALVSWFFGLLILIFAWGQGAGSHRLIGLDSGEGLWVPTSSSAAHIKLWRKAGEGGSYLPGGLHCLI